jgi:hypothetical protein
MALAFCLRFLPGDLENGRGSERFGRFRLMPQLCFDEGHVPAEVATKPRFRPYRTLHVRLIAFLFKDIISRNRKKVRPQVVYHLII